MSDGDRTAEAARMDAGYGPAGSLVVRLGVRLFPIFETETQRRSALAAATADLPELAGGVDWSGPALDFARRIAGWLLTHKGANGRRVLTALLDDAASRVSEVDPENADFAELRAEVEAFRPPVFNLQADAPARPLPAAFAALHDAVIEAAPAANLSLETLQAVIRHRPASLTEYRLSRLAEWSQERYAVDRRFTRLTLMIDRGSGSKEQRWADQPESFDDLRDVLGAVRDRAVVVLGEPGAGKSTLLRRLELDVAVDALRAGRAGGADAAAAGVADAGTGEERVTFFVELSRYAPAITDDDLRKRVEPSADAWLADQWRRRCPELPEWRSMLAAGRVVVLLDALNEMPHAGAADFDDRLEAWREWLRDLPPGNRAVFACRSLDYSAGLSTDKLPVPQARVERMDDGQVRRFLQAYLPDRWAEVWAQIEGTELLDIVKTPFYAGLLVKQTGAGGELPRGRAGLVTGFVLQALRREIGNRDPLFMIDGGLLTAADHAQVHAPGGHAYALPSDGPLIRCIVGLAYAMQAGGGAGAERGREVVGLREACACIDDPRAGDVVQAAAELGIVVIETRYELDDRVEDVRFFHQLFREYFAARRLARVLDPALVATEWRANAMPERLEATLALIAPADPLPPAPATGWEEPAVLAAAMARRPDDFVQAVAAVNLPLAGRCAAEADVAVSEPVKDDLRRRLVARTGDAAADLRARIAAGLALGRLGDPRFDRREGPYGPYLLPPMVRVPAGRYPIGTDRGGWADERPAHHVELPAYYLGQFPVTNAEWALFVTSGGYAEERWWETDAARAWLRGDPSSVEPSKRYYREMLEAGPKNAAELEAWLEVRPGITEVQAPWYEWFFGQGPEELEAVLADWYPAARKTEPRFWNDPAFNAPSQPVVGISWFEARAYCAWLTAQSGHPFVLPSEVEWEAAARGSKGRACAYGDTFDATHCNTFETHIRRTTPVGVFPGGTTLGTKTGPDASAALHDMTGNIWEWTRSLWGADDATPEFRYPYDLQEERREDPNAAPEVRRVVRGGSWGNPSLVARAAYRFRGFPDFRFNALGVRLASSAPISGEP